MKKLRAFGLRERPQAILLKQRLEQEGIACLLRNEELFAVVGEIPFLECRPELWIIDEDMLPRAELLVAAWLRVDEQATAWVCPSCREELPAQFELCWNCGRERDSD